MSPEMQLLCLIGLFVGIVFFIIVYFAFKVTVRIAAIATIALGALIIFCTIPYGFGGMAYGSGGLGVILLGIVTFFVSLVENKSMRDR